jgi:hypothetical protein
VCSSLISISDLSRPTVGCGNPGLTAKMFLSSKISTCRSALCVMNDQDRGTPAAPPRDLSLCGATSPAFAVFDSGVTSIARHVGHSWLNLNPIIKAYCDYTTNSLIREASKLQSATRASVNCYRTWLFQM